LTLPTRYQSTLKPVTSRAKRPLNCRIFSERSAAAGGIQAQNAFLSKLRALKPALILSIDRAGTSGTGFLQDGCSILNRPGMTFGDADCQFCRRAGGEFGFAVPGATNATSRSNSMHPEVP
jgi:hypothetical protein